MITNIIEQLHDTISQAVIGATVVKYEGFIKTESSIKGGILVAVRFIGASPTSRKLGTGETLAVMQFGLLVRHRLEDTSYDLVVQSAEYLATWLKWNRLNIPGISGRGTSWENIRSVSAEFGIPVLEVVFTVEALLDGVIAGNYPFGPPLGGPIRAPTIESELELPNLRVELGSSE